MKPAVSPRPFLKWAGGKWDLAPKIFSYMPQDMSKYYYYEPFMGAGAVFFWLMANGHAPLHAQLGDAMGQLVWTFRAVRNEPEKLILNLSALEHRFHNEEHQAVLYADLRRSFNMVLPSAMDMNALFIFLNKTCFNGLWRVNKKGEFNVPMGDKSKPQICNADLIHSCSRALANTTVVHGDFSFTVDRKEPKVIYYDPPYVPASKTSNFTAYSGSFGSEEQSRLRDHFAAQDKGGAICILSNSDTPLVRDLYKDFEIVPISVRRSISAKASSRAAVGEVIVLGHTRPSDAQG